MNDKRPARAICASILCRWMESGDFPDRMLPSDHPAAALIQEVVFGCVRWKQALIWRMQHLVPRKPDPQTLSFLLVGLYQIFHLDHVPPHAAVHETVEDAKSVLDPARCRFVNAVLRNALRQRQSLDQKMESAPLADRLSHPEALMQRWTRQFGLEKTEALCHWNNSRPSVSIRLFEQAAAKHRDALRSMLQPHPANPEHFRMVPPGMSPTTLPGFSEGSCYVQDPATALSIDLLELHPGLRLLDACAAPGGKTFACADIMHDNGEILAVDRHTDRLSLLHQNQARMGFSCIRIRRGDAADTDLLPATESFDRILLDVPCSNTGVLSRRPDARWRFSMDRISALVSVQDRLLEATSRYLAKDGILVYSTCSLEPEENETLVNNWLARHPDFTLAATRTSTPPASGMDGAFAAQITRS